MEKRMIRYSLMFLTIAFFTACGSINRGCASVTGSSKECVDGVLYIQFTSGSSVAYNTDGTIKRCN